MGVEFQIGDLEALEKVEELMRSYVDDTWELKQFHNTGKIFFKLPVDSNHSAFKMVSNVPIKPGKLINDKIQQFTDITVDLGVLGWYQTVANKEEEELSEGDKNKFGISFKIHGVHFGGAVKKRKKVDEDEVRVNFFFNFIYLIIYLINPYRLKLIVASRNQSRKSSITMRRTRKY
jgi:hypothetical protein